MYPKYKQDKRLVKYHPNFRQIVISQMEFHVFIHFDVNTFKGIEGPDITKPESVFNPAELNADQWSW